MKSVMGIMKLLIIESTTGNANELRAQLSAEGHEVVHCVDDHGPCRGTQHHTDCPLEDHVDLAILTREAESPHTLAEMGSMCAKRHRVPLVVVDPTLAADEMPDVTVAAAVAARAIESGYAAAVRRELSRIPTTVDVRRLPDRVQVNVHVSADSEAAAVAAVADRARYAIRNHDPFVQGIDVAVQPNLASP